MTFLSSYSKVVRESSPGTQPQTCLRASAPSKGTLFGGSKEISRVGEDFSQALTKRSSRLYVEVMGIWGEAASSPFLSASYPSLVPATTFRPHSLPLCSLLQLIQGIETKQEPLLVTGDKRNLFCG